jgi:hypothetical protein
MTILLVMICCGSAANAQGCRESMDYIMSGSAGDLPRQAASYRDLYKVCLQVLGMSGVKDAYVTKDGGIAVIPRSHSVAATAGMLAQFCQAHPQETLRFITQREQRHGLTTGLVVMMSSSGSSSCPKIRGER